MKDEKLWTDRETFPAYRCQDLPLPQRQIHQTTTDSDQTTPSASVFTDRVIILIIIIIIIILAASNP